MGEGFIRRAGADFAAITRSPWLYIAGLAFAVIGYAIGDVLSVALPVAFAVIVFSILLALAPFRQRNELRGQIAQADAMKRGTNKWRADVKRLLEIRAADEPADPDEREQHRKTTVRMYLEHHRDFGTLLIDLMIRDYKINAGCRENVNSPKTLEHIEDALDSIEWGADRYG